MGVRLEAIGQQIQEGVSDDPELYAVAEAGWSRAFDVGPIDGGQTGNDPIGGDSA